MFGRGYSVVNNVLFFPFISGYSLSAVPLLAGDYFSSGLPIKGAPHSCGTAPLLSAAFDWGPTSENRSANEAFCLKLVLPAWPLCEPSPLFNLFSKGDLSLLAPFWDPCAPLIHGVSNCFCQPLDFPLHLYLDMSSILWLFLMRFILSRDELKPYFTEPYIPIVTPVLSRLFGTLYRPR
ncbi:MAG: hypothetical protein PVF74_09990, partial [Anaerolineales bacterium]